MEEYCNACSSDKKSRVADIQGPWISCYRVTCKSTSIYNKSDCRIYASTRLFFLSPSLAKFFNFHYDAYLSISINRLRKKEPIYKPHFFLQTFSFVSISRQTQGIFFLRPQINLLVSIAEMSLLAAGGGGGGGGRGLAGCHQNIWSRSGQSAVTRRHFVCQWRIGPPADLRKLERITSRRPAHALWGDAWETWLRSFLSPSGSAISEVKDESDRLGIRLAIRHQVFSVWPETRIFRLVFAWLSQEAAVIVILKL